MAPENSHLLKFRLDDHAWRGPNSSSEWLQHMLNMPVLTNLQNKISAYVLVPAVACMTIWDPKLIKGFNDLDYLRNKHTNTFKEARFRVENNVFREKTQK